MTYTLSVTNDYSASIAQFLRDAGVVADTTEKGTPEERLREIILSLGELFSLKEPTIDDDLDKTLRTIARDVHLSNIARERALYRIYLVTTTTKTEGTTQVPMWYGVVTDEGELVQTQDEFIRLFTKQSGIGRASVFRRIKVYNQLATFGITGQDAWIKVLQMPYTIQELMKELAVWDRSEFLGVNYGLVLGVAQKMLPEQVPAIQEVLERDHSPDEILEVYSPVVRKMMAETDTYQDAKEALRHIKHDILGTPTVTYRWLIEEEVVMATVTIPIIEDGKVSTETTEEIPLYLDSISPPEPLLKDLFNRLPIINKHELPNA